MSTFWTPKTGLSEAEIRAAERRFRGSLIHYEMRPLK
jgi:hypothetical protein